MIDTLGGAGGPIVVDAWTAIGSFVAVSLVVANLVESVVGRQTVGSLIARPGAGPLGGALLGMIPGCGGAIAVVSLYRSGTAGFGTLLAALVATAGDSAFVLIAVAPRTALLTYAVAFVTAVSFGVVVNACDLAPDRVTITERATPEPRADAGRPDGGRVSAEDDAGRPLATRVRDLALVVWWIAAVTGFTVAAHRMVFREVPGVLSSGRPVSVVGCPRSASGCRSDSRLRRTDGSARRGEGVSETRRRTPPSSLRPSSRGSSSRSAVCAPSPRASTPARRWESAAANRSLRSSAD
ncbi:MAG: protein of unknown function (DUF2899) [uncultured archaeon A07HR67]|jgi:Protein of unknown function (DUF2899).|nr:MAG: protein of unknown function (DUF2899) [uncultured archaeon A07HR67]